MKHKIPVVLNFVILLIVKCQARSVLESCNNDNIFFAKMVDCRNLKLCDIVLCVCLSVYQNTYSRSHLVNYILSIGSP